MSYDDRSTRTRAAYPADARPPRWLLVVALGVAVAAIAVFVMIAEDVVDGGGLISRDTAVLRWFVDHRTDALVSAARVAGTIGSFVVLAIASLIVALLLWRRGRHLLA